MRQSLAFIALITSIATVRGDERLEGIACRSVHLAYPGPVASAFHNAVTIDRSAPGTYFMVCGWSKGYFGMQELADGKKVVLFSVWDPGDQNNPADVADEERVKLLYNDPDVRVRRFGGEGTGGQSFFDFDWEIGQTYRFLVTAEAEPGRSTYTGSVFDPESEKWRKLVTFSTPSRGELLEGCYSFIEDFRRNRVSATQPREARFGDGWLKTAEGKWQPIVQARFTADANPVLNINAGAKPPNFFLATGGDIQNDGAKLRTIVELPPGERQAPDDLP